MTVAYRVTVGVKRVIANEFGALLDRGEYAVTFELQFDAATPGKRTQSMICGFRDDTLSELGDGTRAKVQLGESVRLELKWSGSRRLLRVETVGGTIDPDREHWVLYGLHALELELPDDRLDVGAAWRQGGGNQLMQPVVNPGAFEVSHTVTASVNGVVEIASTGHSYVVPTHTFDSMGDRVEYEGSGVTRYDTARGLILERSFAVQPTRMMPSVEGPAATLVEVALQ